MKYLFLKFTKKTFLTLFLGMSLLLVTQGMQAATRTSVPGGGDWNLTSTWVEGAVPVAADNVTIVSGATVTLNQGAAFTISVLNIESGATLNVFCTVVSPGFTIGNASTIAGLLDFIPTGSTTTNTGNKTFYNVTVTSTGVIKDNKSISLSSTAGSTLTNNGTISTATLGTGSYSMNNYGAMTITGGFNSGSASGNFYNYSGATFNYTGGAGCNFRNYGTLNINTYTGANAASIYNFTGGIVNFTNGTPSATNWFLYASYPGNTVNYSSAANQTVKIPADASYSNLILSGSVANTKTINTTASTALCTGTLTISELAKASITNTNVGVGKLIFNGLGQLVNTYGGLSSTAAVKNGTYFTGNGYLNVTNTFPSWNSAGSGLWSDTTKWSTASVPLAGDAITITQGQPILDSDFALSGTLAISSGATLTVNEGKVLTNTGTITNSGDLILKSSATGTASLLSATSVANVTQQRYLSSNQRGWRLLSNPMASTTFNTIATASGITIGTNFTGEYVPATNTWTSTDGTVNMAFQQAYKVFITGLTGEAPTYTTGPSNVTLVNKGTAANTAPAAIVTANTTTGQFYLVANPYTAPVSVASILAASSGLKATISYYNPTIASNGTTDLILKKGGYDYPTPSGAAGSATDVVIPPMGAFFVQAQDGVAGSISIPKTAIFTGTPLQTGTYNHKTAQTKVASTNALKVEVSSDGVYYDALALQFKAVGDAGSNIDFGKLPNSILDAYSIAGSNKMAVSELELAAQTIPLGITSTIQKSYTFKVAENTIPAAYEAVLVDNVLNTSTVLTAGTSYNFAIDTNPASQGDARFAINLKTTGSLGVAANELDASIQVYPNPSRGQFNITNTLNQKEGATIEISSLNGQVIHSQKLNSGTTTIQTKSWSAGVYILKATNNGTQTTKKLIIQ